MDWAGHFGADSSRLIAESSHGDPFYALFGRSQSRFPSAASQIGQKSMFLTPGASGTGLNRSGLIRFAGCTDFQLQTFHGEPFYALFGQPQNRFASQASPIGQKVLFLTLRAVGTGLNRSGLIRLAGCTNFQLQSSHGKPFHALFGKFLGLGGSWGHLWAILAPRASKTTNSWSFGPPGPPQVGGQNGPRWGQVGSLLGS